MGTTTSELTLFEGHVPCCLLSVPCDLCGAGVGQDCRDDCTHHEVCTCEQHEGPCCERHYAKETA